MNAIKSLHIQGFRSHKDTFLEFAPAGQLTAFTGDGGAGKTAIGGALEWVNCNTPAGDKFINWDEDVSMAKVTQAMWSGHTVIRERSKSGNINRYVTIDPHGERQVYEGFGTSVPLEIQQITGIKDAMVGDMKLNLNMSKQLDGPFLGSSISAPARARILGKLAGTEEVDQANKDLGRDLYRGEQDRKRLVSEVDLLGKQVAEFDYLPGMKLGIDSAEIVLGEAQELSEVGRFLNDRRGLIDIAQDAIDHYQEWLEKTKGAEEAAGLLVEAKGDIEFCEWGSDMVLELIHVDIDITHSKIILNQTKGVDEAASLLSEATTTLDARNWLDSQWNELFRAVHAIGIHTHTVRATAGVDEAMKLLGEAKDMGEQRAWLNDQWCRGIEVAVKIFAHKANLDRTVNADEATELLNEAQQAQDVATTLKALKTHIAVERVEIREAEEVLARTACADEVASLLAEVKESETIKAEMAKMFAALSMAEKTFKTMIFEHDWAIDCHETAEDELAGYLSEIGACPICGGPLGVNDTCVAT